MIKGRIDLSVNVKYLALPLGANDDVGPIKEELWLKLETECCLCSGFILYFHEIVFL